MMTDTALVQRFEAATLTGEEFPHREHVRVAWIYLQDSPLVEVLERFPRHLRKLADALGAPGLYHETVTWFFILLVHDRMAEPGQSWDEFVDANPDLFVRSSEILGRFYTEETWRSDRARRAFVLPDAGR